ncbi:MAG: DUF1727 domain-containing protein [Clostridiaceae bacterium]|nr:DUF1727 domain-containing protein [Clostridiaceae bacterium]
MSFRNKWAIFTGRLTRKILRLLGRQASTLPGRVTLTLAPNALSYIAQNFKVICVTGTNGKTTSTSLLTDVLRGLGHEVVTNRSGANMQMGLMTTLMSAKKRGVAVLEVDEAAFAKCASDLDPEVILVTNIFPDQMDRYGSIAGIRDLIKTGCAATKAHLVVCGDDPNAVAIGKELPNPCVYYGAADSEHSHSNDQTSYIAGETEEYQCPNCNQLMHYRSQVMRQQGDFFCTNCGFQHPHIHYTFTIDHRKMLTVFNDSGEKVKGYLPIEGFFNAVNACGVVAVAKVLNNEVSLDRIVGQFKNAKPQYGRLERIKYQDKELCFVLIKNAAGMEQGVRLVTEMDDVGGVLFVINNQPADGEDVSWIWDTELEKMDLPSVSYAASGSCREQIAQRLEAALPPDNRVTIETDAVALTVKMLDHCPKGNCLYILPNYTAMLDLREKLSGLMHFSKHWD